MGSMLMWACWMSSWSWVSVRLAWRVVWGVFCMACASCWEGLLPAMMMGTVGMSGAIWCSM